MRCYFNLVNSHEIIRDATGIEVSGSEEAYAEAMKAISQWHQEDSNADWNHWRLNVADAEGKILVSISLRAGSRPD
jgi:hypothetical protein